MEQLEQTFGDAFAFADEVVSERDYFLRLLVDYREYAACLSRFFGVHPQPGETIATDRNSRLIQFVIARSTQLNKLRSQLYRLLKFAYTGYSHITYL